MSVMAMFQQLANRLADSGSGCTLRSAFLGRNMRVLQSRVVALQNLLAKDWL
jgi:hypothetical protein